jgi:hypothetical protein
VAQSELLAGPMVRAIACLAYCAYHAIGDVASDDVHPFDLASPGKRRGFLRIGRAIVDDYPFLSDAEADRCRLLAGLIERETYIVSNERAPQYRTREEVERDRNLIAAALRFYAAHEGVRDGD